MKTLVRALFSMSLIVLPAGCGGGSGGDDFIGAAQSEITVNPQTIDTGDHVRVRIRISNVHPDGIGLKVRYPDGLNYVLGTAFLTVGNDEIDVGPKVNTASTTEEKTYLVFYFSQAIFGEDEEGELEFELEATSEIIDGRVEVDPDVDDPLISNDTEFNIEAPEFLSEADAKVEVRD